MEGDPQERLNSGRGGMTGLFLALAALDLFRIMSWQQALSVLRLPYVGVVERFWLFQFLTAPLLHKNLTHLAFNMLTLWMLGPSVEIALGRRRYVVFSVLSAFCSMAGFLLLNLDRGTIGLLALVTRVSSSGS